MDDSTWRKAKASNTGNCVEVRASSTHIEVRDSKDPSGALLRFTPAEWDAFLDGARKGEFDLS